MPLNTPPTWGILGQKGPPPATVLDPLRTCHAPYHQRLDVSHVPWISWVHMNHTNQKLQPLGWHWRTRTCRGTPLRHGDFRPKRTAPSHCLGPIEDLTWPPSPNLDVQHVPKVPLIHTNHSKLKLQPLGQLEDKNVPLNSPQKWGF